VNFEFVETVDTCQASRHRQDHPVGQYKINNFKSVKKWLLFKQKMLNKVRAR
jgi:hypothetical protein